MALVGRLEDLDLTELFHVLSLFQKSGKLTLSSDDKKGVFLFRGGKIVHAANGAPKESLGALLVGRGLITNETLRIALDLQSSEPDHRRLGTVLVDMGAVQQDQIERVIREQLQGITEEFLHLAGGFFSFKPFDEESGNEVHQTEKDIALPTGMNTDQFILDLLTRLDEMEAKHGGLSGRQAARAAQAAHAAESVREAERRGDAGEQALGNVLDYMVDTALFGSVRDESETAAEIADSLADLRSLMVEIQLRSPSFTGEITLMILRFATRVVNRGVLCHVSNRGITGIGQFGLEGSGGGIGSADRRIRDMCIPLHEPSVFMEVLETMHSFRGALKHCRANDELARILGGPPPTEVVVIPIIVDGMIAGMFYGDNAPEGHTIGSVHALELLMIEAGLAMEKTLLRSRLRRVEEQLKSLGVVAEAPS